MPKAQTRMDLSLTPVHAERLQKLARMAGLTRSELVRRWIDQDTERVERAAAAVFGAIAEGVVKSGWPRT